MAHGKLALKYSAKLKKPAITEEQRRGTVFIIEDHDATRQLLADLYLSVGMHVETFPCATDFLHTNSPDTPSCLILDVRLPGMSGLQLQRRLVDQQVPIPIIMTSGYGDIEMCAQALKAGALDFIRKPFREHDMLEAVSKALEVSKLRLDKEKALSHVRAKHATLTSREKEVMTLVTNGLMNKQIAGELNLSEVTVKIHRGQLMRKMGTRSVAELVKVSQLLATA
jgi:FixJ family two-component response regulator